jgi:dihydrodipicolinate synthase/N-acetylneuraminate lyase
VPKKIKKYAGVIIPLVTPFTEDLKIDTSAAVKIIESFTNNNAKPLIFGTTGESASIPEELKVKFLNDIKKEFSDKIKIYAVISDNCMFNSIEAAKKYFDLGIDTTVALLPSYYHLTQAQILNYFEQLIEKIPGKLFIYNIPATTHISISLDVIDKLSRHERIVGVKDSERDLERLKESIHLWKDREDFSHFVGWGAQCFNAMWEGSDGIIPSTGNFSPSVFKDMYEAVLEGEKKKGEIAQDISMEISAIYQKNKTLGESLAALKVMMNEIDLCGTTMMPPLTELDEKETSLLRETTREIIKKYNLK